MNRLEPVVENLTIEGVVALNFDEDGFLVNPDEWSETSAEMIAQLDGLPELEASHWQVINFVRERYFRLGAISSVRQICRSNEMSKEEVKALFGGCLQMWRVAGLPHPGEEAKAYMG